MDSLQYLNDSCYNAYHEFVSKPKPFIQQEAALSILRAADLIVQQAASLMKPFDLTAAQFNVLRILRGAPDGLACGQIGERMLQRDPDITRLLDRMQSRGLILRCRGTQDRRVVITRISETGLQLLTSVDPLVQQAHLRQFQDFTKCQLEEIKMLMDRVLQSA